MKVGIFSLIYVVRRRWFHVLSEKKKTVFKYGFVRILIYRGLGNPDRLSYGFWYGFYCVLHIKMGILIYISV